ncbi:MAG: ribonuclease R [Christensenellaceae bacterium]|jgi:ribonuclease R|nr:ribonuclease R [Christensenellaceae bacterium]
MVLIKNVLDCIQTKGFAGNIKDLTQKVSQQLDEPATDIMSAINSLIKSGDLYEYEPGLFVSSMEAGLLKGKILINSRGFGFLQVDDGDDIFVPERCVNGAFNNDIVLVKLNRTRGDDKYKFEGAVMKILERGTTQIVGKFQQFKGFGYVLSDDAKFSQDVYVAKGNTMNAKSGDVVVVDIIKFTPNRNPEGKVVEVIGDRGKKGNDVLALMRQYKLYEEFPKNVLKEALTIPEVVPEAKKQGRQDFSKITTFTIDGEDAKDFDDAVSLEILPDGNYYLGVHIADVGEYVKYRSILDEEAMKRGTSVYFCDRVIPMLPVELSNGICSLKQGVDRLTLSVMLTINKNGDVINHEICESFIKSKYRMTYTKVFGIINEDKELCRQYSDIVDIVKNMHKLSLILEEKRHERGAINFDFAETQLVLDENGRLVDVKAREVNAAHKLIETFMVIANEVVAEHMYKLKVPFVYRVHEKPDTDKMTMFFNFINVFGVKYDCDISNVRPKDMQKILEKIQGQSYKDVIEMLMLRSLKKAKYLPECLGHFGLANVYYCHFTSPIRRYPDLTIHRIIKQMLKGKLSQFDKHGLLQFVTESSDTSSEREKLAEEMERAVDDLKKVEFLSRHLEEEYEGIISGVIAKGYFVLLSNTCEGFVSFENMPEDYYVYDETKLSLVGKQNFFRLGEKVKIKVKDANIRERRVAFSFVEKVR